MTQNNTEIPEQVVGLFDGDTDQRPVMVTIRCITYNHEAYIRQALEGFVMQKTNFRFEAIVHDDASTDGTAAIIREYAEKYPGTIVPIFEKENQYSKANGSLGRIMKAATRGKYIAWCEGDDYWTDPHKLQKQVDYLEAHPNISACAHQAKVIGEATGLYGPNQSCMIDMESQLSSSRIFHTASIVASAAIYDLPPFTKSCMSGDKLLILRCLTLGNIYYLSDCMCVYRKHGTGVSSNVSLPRLKTDLNIVDYMVSINPKFPKYRYLSFLYGTFAMYPKEISIWKRTYYLCISAVLSFSYFPKNISVLTKKAIRFIRK